MKIIYTAIFNGYDIPPPALPEIEGYTRMLFTDQEDIQAEGWQVVIVPNEPKIFRKIKIMPQEFLPKEHTVSVWHDGNLRMSFLPDFATDKGGFWLMRHPERTCIYEEAKACIQLRKDDPGVIAAQIQKYREHNHPENFGKDGLAATGVIIRENNERFYRTSELWWQEVQQHSVRDQISFPYAAMKTGLGYNLFPFMYGFKWHPHVKNRHNKPAGI